MAAIDRTQLLADEKLWLPDGNVLTDAHMTSINESIISQVGDDDIYYAEVLCKGLRAIAQTNLAKFVIDAKGIKREEVGEVEIERFENSSLNPWKDFIQSLKDICPIFGYTGLSASIGMKINPGSTPVIDDCVCPDKLIF